MRSFIRNSIAAEKARRENGDKGFSLIELIIVVVILGILAAIAVPIFLGLQGQAKDSAVKSAAGNAASQAASDFAQGDDATAVAANVAKLEKDNINLDLAGTGVDTVCVTAYDADASTYKTSTTGFKAGPGC